MSTRSRLLNPIDYPGTSLIEKLRTTQQMSALRAALIEGEESGPSTPFDFEAFIAHKRKQKTKDR